MASATTPTKATDAAPRREAAPEEHPPAFPASSLRIALETMSAAVAAWVFAGVLYRVWDLRWSVPIYEDRADARGVAAQLKTIDETGWWVHNPKLNYPFGQFHADFPAGGESLQHFAMKLLMWVTPGYAQAMNLYYLGAFGLVAAVAFLVVRHLRFPYPIALVLALAYANLPYHLVHEQSHLHRSAYFSAPLACLLLLWALSWRTSFLRDPDPPPGVSWRANLRRGRVLFAVLLAVIVGVSETMTTAFTMALLGASAIVAIVRWREPQRALVAGALIAALLVSFVAVSAPTFVRIAEAGKNGQAGARLVSDSENYALKISRLVLPAGDHRLGPWGRFGERVQEGSKLPTEGGQYLGLLGIAGFLAAIVGLLAHGLRGSGRHDLRPVEDREALTDHASLLVVLSLLLGTVAGFSTLLAGVGFAQVRTWGRIEVILAFCALIVCAIWFERLGPRLRRLRHPTPVIVALMLLVGTFALWDGIPPAHRDYKALAASWVSDERFVHSIEQRMPDGAAIFEFPVRQFPEAGPVARMQDYDLYRGYLHDDGSLRWSYGGVKGRPIADWQMVVANKLGPAGSLPALLGLGYDGVWVDSYGYADGGAVVRRELERVLREQPLRSEDGRLLFYDLAAYKRRLGRSDAQLRATAERQLGVTPPTPLP